MKSFFIFLSRNKAYTAINIIGLSLSLMFLILIGCYVWQETSIDRWHKNVDNIYVISFDSDRGRVIGGPWKLQFSLRDQFPEIVNTCAVLPVWTNVVKNPDGTDNDIKTRILAVDSTFFSVFDFELERGNRANVLKDPHAAVITAEYGRKLFGDADPLGKSFKINSDSTVMVVTGIMKPMENTAFTATGNDEPLDLLIRAEMVRFFNPSLVSETMNNANGSQIFLVGKDGVDLTGESQKYHDFTKNFFWYLDEKRGSPNKLEVIKFKDMYFTQRVYSEAVRNGDFGFVKLFVIFGVVVLIFSLINYVNMTVAQAVWRAKEMSTRRLLGDLRSGIALRLVGESFIMVAIALAVGIFLAVGAAPIASNLLGTTLRLHNLLDPRTIAISVGIVALLGIAAGIIPAIVISSAKPIDVVRGTFRRKTSAAYSHVFIILQNVVTIVMLITAITMYRQTRSLIEAPLGFNTDGIIELQGLGNMIKPLKTELEKHSFVEKASVSRGTPFDGGNNNSFYKDGNLISTQELRCDTAFISLYGIQIEKSDSEFGIFVNHQLLRELGLDENATEFQIGNETFPINGIFKDFRIRSILDPTTAMYIEVLPKIKRPWTLILKVKGDETECWRQICDIVNEKWNINLDEWIEYPYIDQKMELKFRSEQRLVKVVSIFALVALFISALGLIAMSSYYEGLHRREIAVRKVFGSSSEGVLVHLLRTFIINVLIAAVIAIPIGYYLMADWLSQYSYRIPLSWWIFALSTAVCLSVSILSVLIQIWRAANTNPVKALYQN